MIVTALRSATDQVPVIRALDDGDLPGLRRILDAEPIVNAVLAARVESAATLRGARLGGDLVGIGAPGELRAACYLGGNVLPVGGDRADWHALAEHAAAQPRLCSSIIADAEVAQALWPVLEPAWGPARMIRSRQPLLVTTSPARVPADPQLRLACLDDLDRYLPAAVAMLGEELGMAPLTGSARRAYRSRLAGLISARRAFVRLDDAATCCQGRGRRGLAPDREGARCRVLRTAGDGASTAAMAGVIAHALCLAPSVSLYVNDFNEPARRLYQRLGMHQIATLSTILF